MSGLGPFIAQVTVVPCVADESVTVATLRKRSFP